MSDPDKRREVGKAQVRRSTISDTWHRRDDIPAYWGGAGITNAGGICSSGYAVRNAVGTVFSVTAGHCFANGANALVESGLRSYGIVSGRRLPTVTGHPMDMELLGGQSYAGRVYTGGVVSTTSRPVAAAGAASEGYTNYCHSGRTTGENCGHTATDTPAQVCTQSGCKSPVIAFTGGTMIQGGDSGGAFYAIDSAGKALDPWQRDRHQRHHRLGPAVDHRGLPVRRQHRHRLTQPQRPAQRGHSHRCAGPPGSPQAQPPRPTEGRLRRPVVRGQHHARIELERPGGSGPPSGSHDINDAIAGVVLVSPAASSHRTPIASCAIGVVTIWSSRTRNTSAAGAATPRTASRLVTSTLPPTVR